MDEPIPHKGRVLTAMSAFWFEQLADVVGSHLISTDLADLPREAARGPRPAGRVMLCRRAEMLRSSASCGATSPGRRGRSTGPAARCTARRCPPGCWSRDQLPGAGVHAVDQGRRGTTTRTSPSSRRSTWSGAELAERARAVSLELYPGARRWARRARDHHRRHQVRARAGRRRAGPGRRGADPGLVAASGRSTEWEPGPTPPIFDKQPVRDYLDGLDWDKNPPPPAAARRGRRGHEPARYIEAYERITGRSFSAWPGVS